jgi:hypothetical protein
MRIHWSWRFAAMLCGLLLATSLPMNAGTIGVRWDPAQHAAGYRIYYGQTSGQYSNSVDVGNVVEADIGGLADCTTYYLAVKAYNAAGESVEFSNEISGWSRPEISSFTPSTAAQGSQHTLDIMGSNFEPGAELILDTTDVPTDSEGNPLVVIENVNILSCDHLQALMTVEPSARGVRAMEVGDFTVNMSVCNPSTVYGSESASLEIEFNASRSDINRSDATTTDRVDGKDLIWLAYAYGASEGESYYNPDADLDGDGMVDGVDLAYLAASFGMCWNGASWSSAACP